MEQKRRPLDTALRQQRIHGWKPVLHPVSVIVGLSVLGGALIPLGWWVQTASDGIVELSQRYDNLPECSIQKEANANRTCRITLPVPKEMNPPILIYYQLTNFYQNHRKYVFSKDDLQLKGQPPSQQSALARSNCEPLHKLGNTTLNPCGLFANTLFNDVFVLQNSDYTMEEKGIAWTSDLESLYSQPKGFRHQECLSCSDSDCRCDNEWSCNEPWRDPSSQKCFLYDYPDDDTTQYLYETYPMVVNPIEGVTNEHFVVWMRPAALPEFRKLYGFIQTKIQAGANLTFDVTANFEVESFRGSKTLVVTTTHTLGGKNFHLSTMLEFTGYICLSFGLLFGLKHLINPRKLGDTRYLRYKQD